MGNLYQHTHLASHNAYGDHEKKYASGDTKTSGDRMDIDEEFRTGNARRERLVCRVDTRTFKFAVVADREKSRYRKLLRVRRHFVGLGAIVGLVYAQVTRIRTF